MKVRELMEHLAEADPEAEVITDVWNGRVSTFTVLDSIASVKYDWLKKDFFEAPGAFDKHFHDIKSGKLFYISSSFTNADSQLLQDRLFVEKLSIALIVDEPDDVKAVRLLQMVRDFDEGKHV